MLTHLCHLRIIIGIKLDKLTNLTLAVLFFQLSRRSAVKSVVIKHTQKKKEVEDVAADNCCEHFNFPCGAYSVPEISRSTIALCEWVHCISFDNIQFLIFFIPF